MNKVILSGRLVNDDFKVFKSNKGVSLTFKIALIENSKKTNFVDIVCFDKLANSITEYIKKGDLLEIEGKLNNSKYIAKNDETIYKTEILAKNITFSVRSKHKQEEDKKENKTEEFNNHNIYGFDFYDEDEE
ncbi:single-stranded DNA-binding protein [Metamycoplasma hyosynoviae]|uniref:Single-stranded DNA-binding protein n=1 Tax=Metamycoplasma hyosynoviae TaxID=29559 RepID=A0A9Q9BNY8_9BACT|nr:single-stranded DNA-binding protein [Metamycoplasma hyosynoviae]MDC8915964.1 single-stranded DNA-binding protein [Metamycoplasma hyosynoviae]MDC8917154.1 single-stranded DNA-binding protein [Metamycoplasma hyosynoviae]MDD1374619.1 single-stranded DNA-binding protein [Metamycoplasma hyosynoviae]UTO25607.1 single-stranded DNA-binding protein [Metamycoplasma hyosynoviae]